MSRTPLLRAFSIALCAAILMPGFALSSKAAPQEKDVRQRAPRKDAPSQEAAAKTAETNGEGGVYRPAKNQIRSFPPVNVAQMAWEESLAPQEAGPAEIKSIDAPRGRPESFENMGVAIPESVKAEAGRAPLAPPAAAHGTSPGPDKTFKGEFMSGTSIPPDTMGAVGLSHVVNVTNDRMRIQSRSGVEISRFTLSSFWAGITLEGGAAVSAFDPKVLYDRFNNRWILISSANAQTLSSAALFAVSQTDDPTGLWNRYAVDADPTATATGGLWIDYPTIGHNKNWIVVHENTFGYGTIGGYQRSDVYVIDKQAAYANTLSTISVFQAATSTCTAPFESKLGCGFTMAPTIVEDNTTEEVYLVEDWDSQAGQLRLSKITGTPAAPVLTVGTQFPQSPNSWRFNAARIGTTGGYVPQRQQSANLPSGTRIMANDSRMQNAVLRNGSLWCTHTVMLAAAPTAAGVAVGGAANPDIRSGVQWWQIDPTVETATPQPPIQRGRIEDPTANNCHNGSGGTSVALTCDSTAEQVGQFYAFPNISVNKDNDLLIGYTMFSSRTYPNAAYSIRRSTDTPNTVRDTVVYRPGQATYNIGSGAAGTTARQNRWGDYSASMVDPANDTDFWTVQEYAGTVRDFGIGLAGNWETWWALVRPSATQPSTAGTLIISEFRLRGPQGVRDEFVELYNPSITTPVVVNATDNSEGWSLVYSNNGTAITSVFAVIPNGTVIPPRGHLLVASNPNANVGFEVGCGPTTACGPTLVYSLNTYPGIPSVRGADSDVGYSVDLADNGGIALFKSSDTAAGLIAANRLDSVGFNGIAAGLFKEGTGIPDTTGAPTSQISFVRNLSGGDPQDTNNNASDFIFVSPTQETLVATSRLGTAGPANLDGPRRRDAQFKGGLIDPCVAATAAPNRSRDLTPVTNGAAGTLTIRRRYINNAGVPVTRLRFRVVDVSAGTAPAGTADVRALSSTSAAFVISAACGSLPMTVQGTTVEEPPAQPGGGGLNTSLSAGSVSLGTPLAPGSAVNVQFVLGVQQAGTFRFFITLEALFDGVVTGTP